MPMSTIGLETGLIVCVIVRPENPSIVRFIGNLMFKTALIETQTIYCIIKTDEVAKKFPQFCNDDFLIIAKGH